MLTQVFERDGIEVVVRQGDETKTAPPQVDDFLEHFLDVSLPRALREFQQQRTEQQPELEQRRQVLVHHLLQRVVWPQPKEL